MASAEEVLIRQIERAASQGLVAASPQGRPTPAPAAEPRPQPADAAARCRAPAAGAAPSSAASEAAGRRAAASPRSASSDQVEATTVFDRDSRNAPRRARRRRSPDVCLAGRRGSTSGPGRTACRSPRRLPALRRQLVGEFDAPDPAALRDLARLYIRFGFGAEAEALLAGFGAAGARGPRAARSTSPAPSRDAPCRPDGPLAVAAPCPGQPRPLAGARRRRAGLPRRGELRGVQAAFAALPADLRRCSGPRLVGRLLDAGHARPRRG